MNASITRRQFLTRTATVGATAAAITGFPSLHAADANQKLRIGVMGTNGRGMAHISGFLAQPNVEISHICDVDYRAIEKGVKAVAAKQTTAPKGVDDIRKMLEDPELDAISIAAPNHWHAPATILACAAGKHVYVEKPCCHNPHEGELMLAAARKYNRRVQMGNQRRSYPWVQEAVALLHAGEIGRVTFARCSYNNARQSIGKGQAAPLPTWLNFDLWQGPAPERPYKDNILHYNWHWFWHWGNGELGNNGIHSLDLVRWGLGVEFPKTVACGGGRYQFDDDQETPDIYVTSFDFGDKGATWEGHSSHPRGFEGVGSGVTFYGEKGYLIIGGNGYKVLDLNGKELKNIAGKHRDSDHFTNFVESIRGDAKLNSEIEEGVKSTLLCHLGNIAYRTGHTLHLDPKTHRITNDKEAMALWKREYRKGWEPKV
jgi:predicted dehydrogenase